MKKSKFIKSTIILLIGGLITKILGMIIRIAMGRNLGSEGMGIYMLIMPTFSLLIAFSQLGFPIAISKLVAEDKYNNKNMVFSSILIALLVNIIIIFLLLFFSDFISINLLHEKRTFYGLLAIGLVLPFISISSILRGYFFGKEKMIPHVLSNTIEDITRLIIIIVGVPIFLVKGIEFAVMFVILSNIGSELISIIIFFFFLPKHFKLKKNDFIINNNVKNILKISLPTTGSRLIGSIGYFFEPIILTTVLIKMGYTNSFIVNEYGIITGYVLPLILLPSFFTNAISQALIPTISYSYSKNNFTYVKNKIKQAIFISLLIGIPITIFFVLFPSFPLKIIYNTSLGSNYLRIIAPFCLLFYIQSPLTSSLQAMGKAKIAMKGTLISMIIRLSCLFVCSSLKIGLWSLIIATSFNIVFVTLYDLFNVIKILKKKSFC
ncbi:MAG: oligosaccharide flippase family protein [Bacilli bacterium]